jgi:NAD-dependent dihydropyrimidine dehydrogenase PreA subunit
MVEFLVDRERCIGADACGGTCARICPPDAITYEEWEGKKVPVADTEICMKDHGCENNCPVMAITILPPRTDSRDF